MESSPGRAAEVLERLAREQGERRSLRPLAVVAALACVAAVGAALVLDRRPAPVEERMPVASDLPAPEQEAAAEAAPADAALADAARAEQETPPVAPGGPVVVHVAGAVASPGVVELPGGSRIVDAVEAAGGLRADADADRVNLAAVLADGQRVVIPVRGQPPPEEVLPSGPSPEHGGAGGGVGTGARVDVNTADAEQLESLPGIGPATAAAILSHRERHGPFRSVDDLIDVRGIGEAKLDALRDLVTVGGATVGGG